MKKKLFFIVACVLFVLYSISGCFYSKHKRRYKIVGASLQRAIVEDSAFKDYNVYLLHFDIVYCDDSISFGFMQDALGPGVFGCSDSIQRISVTDLYNKDVDFINEPIHEYNVGESSYYIYSIITGGVLDSLVNDINNNGADFDIRSTVCYKLDPKMPRPKHLKIYSNHGVVNGIVNENPVILRIEKDN